MVDVPEQFRPIINVRYPSANIVEFERWFYEQYEKDETDREYLPIFWTAWYVNNNYGNDKMALAVLQEFINGLDKSKKYFTIIQYDDSILNDVSKLDLYQLNMSKPYDYPLPLIGQPYPYKFDLTQPKKYLANFVGGMTHPIREHAKTLQGKDGYYISFERHEPYEYCKIISESIFTLAYRGYGQNSFRVAESLQYDSIPMIICTDNDFIKPHNLEIGKYGFAIPQSALSEFEDVMKVFYDWTVADKNKFKNNVDIYQEYFTYSGTRDKILKHLLTLK